MLQDLLLDLVVRAIVHFLELEGPIRNHKREDEDRAERARYRPEPHLLVGQDEVERSPEQQVQ